MKKQIIVIFMLFALVGMTVAKSKSKSKGVEQPVLSPSNEESSAKPISIVDEFEGLAKKLVGAAVNKPTFAFMALTSDDGNALVENYVTDALTEAMFATGKIKVVERTSLEKIMSEQQFQSSAFVNENTAAEIGNLSGADFVCYGTLRDLQDQISVSVRVVEVSTAELYAMSRDTIDKDIYLANVGFEKRKENAKVLLPKTIGGSSAESVVTNVVEEENSVPEQKVDSLWQVQKRNNGIYTTYTFILKGSGRPFLFVGFDKYDISSSSRIKSGVASWGRMARDVGGVYDIKVDNGSVINKKFSWAWWTYDIGYGHDWTQYGQGYDNYGSYYSAGYLTDGKTEVFAFTYNQGQSQRFFVELFENNKFIVVRHNNESFRFKCEGFWQTVEEQGLTREEIYDAIANEEF